MEPSTTDKKFRTDDEHIHEEDKRRVAEQPEHAPEGGKNPVLEALQAKRAERDEQEEA